MGIFDRLRQAAVSKAPAQQGSQGVPYEFAILDVETTGLDARVHRIIEIGIVITDSDGNVKDEFSTLVRPEGDVVHERAAQRVHLIEEQWLKAAPPTSEVLAEVAHRINGRIIVAHNAKFDTEFLEQEFKRCLGYSDDDLGFWMNLCTIDLCRGVDLPRKLEQACYQLGIRYDRHAALGDCHATAQLLHRFMHQISRSSFEDAQPTQLNRMPDWRPVQRVHREFAATATEARPVLADLVAQLPLHDGTTDRDPAATDAYLAVLQDAIADGYVSAEEVETLTAVATRYGLTADELRDLHQELVLGLLDTALDDNKISKAEREEIEQVGRWLGVDLTAWDAMVKAARARIKAAAAEFRAEMQGKTVAFTGVGIHNASIREALCTKLGIAYSSRVSDDTDLLVIGTEQTETQQVEKARAQGVPVIVESSFWRRLGEV